MWASFRQEFNYHSDTSPRQHRPGTQSMELAHKQGGQIQSLQPQALRQGKPNKQSRDSPVGGEHSHCLELTVGVRLPPQKWDSKAGGGCEPSQLHHLPAQGPNSGGCSATGSAGLHPKCANRRSGSHTARLKLAIHGLLHSPRAHVAAAQDCHLLGVCRQWQPKQLLAGWVVELLRRVRQVLKAAESSPGSLSSRRQETSFSSSSCL